MKIPFKYSIRSLLKRRLTMFITVIGIALVVFVFSAVLMMAYGIEKTLVSTGLPDNIMVVRKSATSEITSIVDAETQNVIKTLPHIAKAPDNTQIISNEVVVVITLEILTGGLSNVTVRGVEQTINLLRPNVKLKEGRMFNPSLRELIVGEKISKKFKGAQIGSTIVFAGDVWKIVGIFESNGNGFESELWGDSKQLLNAFNRGSAVSSVTLKLDHINNFDSFKKAFESDRRLQAYEPKSEQKFFEEQSELLAGFIRIVGIFITIVFSFGATIGAMITMYSAVANRTVEIETMRSLGFRRRSIMTAFLVESLLISLIGGVLGLILASFLQFFSVSTLNWNSFAELSFSFALSPNIITSSLIFALAMGLLGGFLPSVRAARMNIVSALRAG
ncbi:MAG: ABC transporter permease [Ignavibacteria bacterium]|nr:ABC transporter permease [Ignavibacteria bacterium]